MLLERKDRIFEYLFLNIVFYKSLKLNIISMDNEILLNSLDLKVNCI